VKSLSAWEEISRCYISVVLAPEFKEKYLSKLFFLDKMKNLTIAQQLLSFCVTPTDFMKSGD
jgi:hypothetical protein